MAARKSPVAAARAGRAGFTLVELMVAMTGGLFLSIVVFALSRDATRFYQQETRVANATLSGVTGFERLANDIARAGHLVTPNINADPRVCNRPTGSWPARLQNLRAITINTDVTQLAGTEIAAAGGTPMAIEIAGALDMVEELSIAQVGPNGGSNAVFIRLDTPAASRLGLVNDPGQMGANRDRLLALLMPNNIGRTVRITQIDGMEQYAVVSGVQTAPSLNITLANDPALAIRTSAAGTAQCGILGNQTGGSLSVVNIVRYELLPLVGDTSGPYADLFRASGVDGGLPYESGRVELVRTELSPAGAPITATREIISEYAVDLQFSAIAATSPVNPTPIPVAAASLTNTYPFTQLVRGIHARLSVRSREADRLGDVTGAGGSGMYRFQVAAGGTGPQFARVRTFQSDIALRNLEGANW
jgi:hypothetical protein